MRGLFSFCFSFTDFQLETVSKAFHITFWGFAVGWDFENEFVNLTKNKNMEHETKINHENPPAAKPLFGVVFCSECNTRIETYNQDHMRWVELIDTETATYLCSSECRIKMERLEEGF